VDVKLGHEGGHRVRVFGNRVLREIFGAKRNEVRGGWTKPHNEELHDLYSTPSKQNGRVKEDEMVGHGARMGEKMSSYRILVETRYRNR
jgi:hypothetical protein